MANKTIKLKNETLDEKNDKVMLTEDDWIISRILQLNSDLASITRELHEKNIALKKANITITKLMHTDHLTGLINRRFLFELLEKQVSLAKRHLLPLALVMADLDHFKSVNDEYGHIAGDRVLVTFASILNNHGRKEDVIARIGGEEFLVVLPQTNALQAAVFTERIRSATYSIVLPDPEVHITASLGVTELRTEDSVESLIKRADDALYEAKNKGRNQFCTL